MSIVNGYATLAQFKQRFSIGAASSSDASDLRDADMELVIQGVCRAIDRKCGRVFWQSSTDETRHFTPEMPYRAHIDDLVSLSSLETDEDGDETFETVWAATDYRLMPANAPAHNWPYMWVEIKPHGNYRFPRYVASLKVTGVWGWAAVPDEIREACLLQSNRIWQRRNSPFGVLGSNEFGAPVVINKLDPDIEQMIAPYVRHV